MAPLPEDVFIEAVEQLVRIDSAWVPGGEGSLYLRPFMIANEVFLGVKPSAEYIFGCHRFAGRLLFQGRTRAGVDLGVGELHARRGRRHRRRQMRRQLCRQPARAGRGHRSRLRSSGFPRCDRAPLRRGTRRHERLLCVRRRFDADAAARHHPARHHPRFDHRAGEGFRRTRARRGLHDRPVARGRRQRQTEGSLRLRHGGGDLADRQGVFRRAAIFTSLAAWPAPSPWGCARSWSTSSTARASDPHEWVRKVLSSACSAGASDVSFPGADQASFQCCSIFVRRTRIERIANFGCGRLFLALAATKPSILLK